MKFTQHISSARSKKFLLPMIALVSVTGVAPWILPVQAQVMPVSPPSMPVIILPDTQVPSIPTGLTSPSKTSSRVVLSWAASTDNFGVIGYYVYLNDQILGTTTSTTFTHSNLQPSTTYTYRVSSYDAAGNNSPWTLTLAVTTSMPSLKIGDLVKTIGTWNVRAIPALTGTLLGTQPAGSTGLVVGGPTDASGITWLQVNYTTGVDGWTGADGLVKSVDTEAPSTPTALIGSAPSTTQINLSWAPSTDNVGVAGYKIYRDGVQIGTSTGTAFSDSGLVQTTSYTYAVAAFDAAGNTSPLSAPLSDLTQTPAVTGLAVGDSVVTMAKLNVRGTPSARGTKLGSQPLGAQGTIIGGPQSANGYVWWQIDYANAPDGWSVANYLAKSYPALPLVGTLESSTQSTVVMELTRQIAELSQKVQDLTRQLQAAVGSR